MILWLFGTSLIVTISLSAQAKRGSLEGVWQAAEVTIFTARNYTRVEVQADKPRPVLENAATATAEQLREV